MRFAFCLAIITLLAGPLSAQSVTLDGDVTFDPLSFSGFEVSDVYTINDNFAETYGVSVPAPVRFAVPRHGGLAVQALAVPDGGALMGFVFTREADGTFMENFQFTNANIPQMPDHEDPVGERIRQSAQLLEQQIFPNYTNGFERAEIFAIEVINLGNVENAVQLVAGYFDQQYNANMMLRAVILPHPDQAASFLAVANIDLDVVPVTNAETLAATISGRVLSSWEYQ